MKRPVRCSGIRWLKWGRRPARHMRPAALRAVEQLPGRIMPSFLAPVAYDVGANPVCVAVGDFSGNGDLGIVTANHPDSDVSVLQGNGDGTFQALQNYPTGLAPEAVAVGDFTGSGRADIAVTNALDNTVSVLLNNGDGTFQSQVVTATGRRPYFLAAADLTGKGTGDLVVTNYQDGTVSVLLGNGDGSFQAAGSYDVGTAANSVAIGDFNGDGIPDLAVTNKGDAAGIGGTLSVLLGNGDGTFQPAQHYTAGMTPWSVAIGDFNGDGIPDLAVANRGSSSVSIFLGNGDGSFQHVADYAADLASTAVGVGDFNGDGIADLATASFGNNTVSVFLGNGDGAFQPAQNYEIGSDPFARFLAVGDFNGDGYSDLVVANEYTSQAIVLLNAADGTSPDIRTGQTLAPISMATGPLIPPVQERTNVQEHMPVAGGPFAAPRHAIAAVGEGDEVPGAGQANRGREQQGRPTHSGSLSIRDHLAEELVLILISQFTDPGMP